MKHALPHQRGNVIGDGPGQDQDQAEPAAAEDRLVQRQCQYHRQPHCQRHIGGGPQNGDQQGPVEIVEVDTALCALAAPQVKIPQYRQIVVHTHPARPERHVLVEHRGIGERQQQAVQQREKDQQGHTQHGRQDIEVSGTVMPPAGGHGMVIASPQPVGGHDQRKRQQPQPYRHAGRALVTIPGALQARQVRTDLLLQLVQRRIRLCGALYHFLQAGLQRLPQQGHGGQIGNRHRGFQLAPECHGGVIVGHLGMLEGAHIRRQLPAFDGHGLRRLTGGEEGHQLNGGRRVLGPGGEEQPLHRHPRRQRLPTLTIHRQWHHPVMHTRGYFSQHPGTTDHHGGTLLVEQAGHQGTGRLFRQDAVLPCPARQHLQRADIGGTVQRQLTARIERPGTEAVHQRAMEKGFGIAVGEAEAAGIAVGKTARDGNQLIGGGRGLLHQVGIDDQRRTFEVEWQSVQTAIVAHGIQKIGREAGKQVLTHHVVDGGNRVPGTDPATQAIVSKHKQVRSLPARQCGGELVGIATEGHRQRLDPHGGLLMVVGVDQMFERRALGTAVAVPEVQGHGALGRHRPRQQPQQTRQPQPPPRQRPGFQRAVSAAPFNTLAACVRRFMRCVLAASNR